ncbi:MAG TPA: GFA family protein [Steroidobacteraceae bacterium]|nr:GFA family protein [Steroidobacteraceae bacterium]
MACHCRGCQRMSASAFSLTAAIPAAGFEVSRGEPVLGGLRNPELRHFFCPACMTWMFTRFLPEFVNVRATLFDDLSWFSPFVETWTRTKLPWVTTPAVHSYAEFPPMEDYAMLTAEFASTLTR